MKRQRNDGIRKVCGCARRAWAKCSHPWHFSFKWAGTHHRFSLDKRLARRVETKTEAEAEAERLRTEIRAGKGAGAAGPARDRLTLAQLLETYRRDYLAPRPEGVRTGETYQINAVGAVVLRLPTGESQPFGRWRVVDVTTAALEQFRTVRMVPVAVARTGRGSRRQGGPVTANRDLALLRSVFNWAVRMGLVEHSPFKRGTETVVRLARERRRSRRLQDGEETRLLAAASPHLYALIVAALESGMRLGELLGLRWMDVQGDEIRLTADRTKTRAPRTIPITPRLKGIIEMRRHDPAGEAHEATAFVFGTEIGTRVGSVKTAWAATCRRADITGLHFHDLRREAGSRWMEAGVSVHTVQAWLGHTNVAQTSTYLATTANASHDAMRRVVEHRARLQGLATGAGNGVHSGVELGSARDENAAQETAGHTRH